LCFTVCECYLGDCAKRFLRNQHVNLYRRVVVPFVMSAVLGVVLNAQLVATLPRKPLPKPSADVHRAVVHQNRTSAGRLEGTRLRLELDIVESAWKPEGVDDPEVPILAFAERGKTPLVPGPMIRVRRGTSVSLSLRNSSDSVLVIHGLRPGRTVGEDTVQIAARSSREITHVMSTAGTFLYWGAFAETGFFDRLWKDSQLNGAIVVDEPGASTNDHVLVISEWFHPYDEPRAFEVVSTINGKGWPHSETLTLNQNDSTRFRVLNAIPLEHPLHLHGFYYRIESQGNGSRDSRVPMRNQHLSNTDILEPGHTVTLSFKATTPGNWLFHCHLAFHVDETVTLAGSPKDSVEAAHLATHPNEKPASHAANSHSMRGLAIGIKVNPAPGYVAATPANAREVRLLAQSQPGRLITGMTAYGFVLQNGKDAPAKDSVVLPGPVIELKRGEPVRITVKNNLSEPTSIHWHGLEIESFPDGVPHWSGLGAHVYSQIAPSDSFVAAFTPPRSGTYPYHSHLNDRHQINSGMYGALIVTDKPRDLTRDHVIVVGGGGPELIKKEPSPFALVNGRRSPRALRLTAGVSHRLRIVTIHPDWAVQLTLRNDSSIARWRALAKDGADLPRVQQTVRPATVKMGAGQTFDVEFTPTAPGDWVLEVRSIEPGWSIVLPVEAVAPKRAGGS
jgi:FtsP/CotA-like multicopper oxidase with cupredoxin domain